ncbi:SDR family oxidoreductase [Sphingomonas immobilis]|uniref:Aldehyde reductase n=1 Tax=Sphingomonas immobilis TaxID=3063997 RepID=A0ABT9A2D7_9SPHN|nr:aldehyde reductase [Sphingomonas sp. CA1-15]MDO7843156.1 aldehyde reductase [Sphingomonas sp. CA1-15]
MKDAANTSVLVTGGSGFVGGYVVLELLRQGYCVRTTIRSLSRENQVRAMLAEHVDAGDRLSFVAADLLNDDGWDAAVAGCAYVHHVASPMPVGEFRGTDVITPARAGTRRVLEASARAGVRRVVITSSTAAAMPDRPGDAVIDERTWTDRPDRPAFNYPRAKTLAEQDAWAFVRDHDQPFELTTVLPASIQGPVLGSDYSASVDLLRLMLKGKMPAVPRMGYNIVDVRDLAALHLLAMITPEAAGQRYIAAGDFLWFSDIARILREGLGDSAARTPKRTIPDFIIRLGAFSNPEMRQIAPILGQRTTYSSAKAESLLGHPLRSARDAVLDAARSLIDRGLA